MTRIFPIHPIVVFGTNRYRFAIVRDGHRRPELITVRIAGDVLPNLLPSGGIDITAAHQFKNSRASWPVIAIIISRRATDDNLAIASYAHRISKKIHRSITVDGLAERDPVSIVIFIGSIYSDVYPFFRLLGS